MEIFVTNETSRLETVILGIGIDRGKPRGINPSIRKHLSNGEIPTTIDICQEMQSFEKVLKERNIEVLRPENLKDTEQIFTRDIGFVIEDKFFISNMKHQVRKPEIKGIESTIETIDSNKIVQIPDDVTIEGGDVILWNNYIFLGQGARTNKAGLQFLQDFFPNKKVIGLDIVEAQDCFDKHILHLDCTFQPIGKNEGIIYAEGFNGFPSILIDIFKKENLIFVNQTEKNRMFPNVFSISPSEVIIEKGFERLKLELEERGYVVYLVDYKETSKLGGLLRCSTLPLRRQKNVA